VKITADTNVLIRVLTRDDVRQSAAAEAMLTKAEVVALTMPALCEAVRVLSQGYKVPGIEIARAIRRLIDSTNIAVDRPAAEAGLAVLEQGGDFADGVIAHEGKWLGGETFVSFDKKAVKLVQAAGGQARLLE
jgi:predicted nucleic-acid-binding protein